MCADCPGVVVGFGKWTGSPEVPTMRGKESGASLIGLILALIIVVIGAYFMLQTAGVIGSGNEEEEPGPIDQAVITTAITELRMVKQGLEMYRTLGATNAYPATDEINSLEQLLLILPAGFTLPDSVSFRFSSYSSPDGNQFLLMVQALDSGWTMLEVGSGFGPRIYQK